MFEILEHIADVGFRARGRNRAELFASAALALESIAIETDKVCAVEYYPIAVAGEDEESLLVNWLSEVLYYLDGRQVVFGRFEIDEISPTAVQGRGCGEPRHPERHPPKLVVKGVTYHQLKIAKDAEGWFAEVYLDV
ncbi:MAG: archease [Bryobacterales bacterium]|nr:archease [Bryobacterales bacterium]